jgi:hypothetical protein
MLGDSLDISRGLSSPGENLQVTDGMISGLDIYLEGGARKRLGTTSESPRYLKT